MIIDYRVTLVTPKGVFDVDLKSSQGPEAAARRAQWSLIAARYGDVDEVTIAATVTICGWFATCENEATGTMPHPILGNVPTCDSCRQRAEAGRPQRQGSVNVMADESRICPKCGRLISVTKDDRLFRHKNQNLRGWPLCEMSGKAWTFR